MKKALVSVLAVGAILLTTSCSSTPAPTAAERSPVAIEAAESATPESPSAFSMDDWESAQKKLAAEYGKHDIKFEFKGASKSKPYGVSYPSSRGYSFDGAHSLGGAELAKATSFGMEAYYALRTDPAFFKNDRTSEKDHKALSKHKNFDKNILDELETEEANGDIFDWIPAYNHLTEAWYQENDDPEKYIDYLIDTTKTQKISIENFKAEPAELTLNGKTGVIITYTEVAKYALQDGGQGEVKTENKIVVAKPGNSWKLHGMHWNSPEQTMTDSQGKTLPKLVESLGK